MVKKLGIWSLLSLLFTLTLVCWVSYSSRSCLFYLSGELGMVGGPMNAVVQITIWCFTHSVLGLF